jgi:hypothetical protein
MPDPTSHERRLEASYTVQLGELNLKFAKKYLVGLFFRSTIKIDV